MADDDEAGTDADESKAKPVLCEHCFAQNCFVQLLPILKITLLYNKQLFIDVHCTTNIAEWRNWMPFFHKSMMT